MYRVYCDNFLIYDTRLNSLKIFEPKLSLELNVVGSFEFTIYPDHPYFEKFQKLKSVVKVYQDNRLIFKGRVIDDVNGWYNEKKVSCESDIAYLLDSIQRPYDFQGTPTELFTHYIQSHNAQVDAEHQFKIGNVTVTDPNDYIVRASEQYPNTWAEIQEKLIDLLGGYIWVRYEDDGAYIDYLADFESLLPQTIEFGKNLIDFTRIVKASDIFTVIVPVGAQTQDKEGNAAGKLTIESVNDGKDYLEHPEAIERYGRIVKMVEWQDVTLPENLKTKAQAEIDNASMLMQTITLTAADLSATDKNVLSFRLGTKVRVISRPHNLDAIYLVKKLSINLMKPDENKIQLGETTYTITDNQVNDVKNIVSTFVTKTDSMKTDVIMQVNKQTQSEIQASSESILSTVSEQCYAKGEVEQLISEKTAIIEQSIDGWEFTFKTLEENLNDLASGTDAEFKEIQKYIRFIDGKVLLGEVGNELELEISNDRISFMQSNSEIAYFSNNKLYVVDGEFTTSMQLGKFAFLPRTNGNLSFKKVRD